MNLSTLLKQGKTLGKSNPNPMTRYDEKILFQIIDEARYTPNGALLVFDFTPYLQDVNVNLNSVEVFIDLFILANSLNNSYTKHSPMPKIFVNYDDINHPACAKPYGVDVYCLYRLCQQTMFVYPKTGDIPSHFRGIVENNSQCNPESEHRKLFEIKDFLHNVQKDGWEIFSHKGNLPSILKIDNMENIVRLQNGSGLSGDDIMSIELCKELMKINNKEELLEHYFNNFLYLGWYKSAPEKQITSSRRSFISKYMLDERYYGTRLKALPEFANIFFEAGDFVTIHGEIVQDIYKFQKDGSFEIGFKEVQENEFWMVSGRKAGDQGNVICGIMVDDSHYIEINDYCSYLLLKKEAEHRKNRCNYNVPTIEQLEVIIKNKDKINPSLEKVGLPPLGDWIACRRDEYDDQLYCCEISMGLNFTAPVTEQEIADMDIHKFFVKGFTNGYFFKE